MPGYGVVFETHEIHQLGGKRRYLVIRPDGVDAATVPTIVDLHGSGSWPEEHAWVTAAAAFGGVVVVPQAGIPFRFPPGWPTGWAWNVPGSPLPGESVARTEPDDVAFIEALVVRLIEGHGVDRRRIHLRGFSGGARLASHLLARIPDRLASVCCVAGVRFVEPSPGRLPPLLAIHGALDSVNPYAGGGGPRWAESVESVVEQWAAASGCDPTPIYRDAGDQVREVRYVARSGFAPVRLLTVGDGEHSWPGTRHGDHIEQFGRAGSWEASQAHWDFVRDVECAR